VKLKSLEDLRELLPESERSAAEPPVHPPAGRGHDGRGEQVRILIDRKGRKGKTVTLVTGLRHNPDTMKEVAAILKERCGTGGTVKEGNIELQGDQRERARAELEKMNYVVRRP
jgi:predicted translation initiation factor SUI1